MNDIVSRPANAEHIKVTRRTFDNESEDREREIRVSVLIQSTKIPITIRLIQVVQMPLRMHEDWWKTVIITPAQTNFRLDDFRLLIELFNQAIEEAGRLDKEALSEERDKLEIARIK